MRNLLAAGRRKSTGGFPGPGELLAACGQTVLITDYFDYYRWRLPRRTHDGADRHRDGVPSLIDLFDEKNHASCPVASWKASGGCSRTA